MSLGMKRNTLKLAIGDHLIEVPEVASITINHEVIEICERNRLTDWVRHKDLAGRQVLQQITAALLRSGVNAVLVYLSKTDSCARGWAVYRNGLIHYEEDL